MEIEIKDNVVIPCPLFRFGLRQVKHCLTCDHYKGMAQATVNGNPIDSSDIDAFQVICGKPITRRMQKIIVE